MSFRRTLAIAGLMLMATCAAPAPGSEEACRIERVGSFTLTEQQTLRLVTVEFDGKPARLIFDTGASVTTLMRGAEERLGLRAIGVVRLKAQGVGGSTDAHAGSVDQLAFAGTTLANRVVMVNPFDLVGFGEPAPDGLLGADVLSLYDIELDLKANTGALYRPRNCPAGQLPWPAGYSTFPLHADSPSGRTQLPIEINGRPFTATLDTGASSTLVELRTAHKLGITDDMLAQDRTVVGHGVAADTAKIYAHRFDHIRIGNESFANVVLGVVEMPSTSGDMLIGINFLRNRKLWLSPSSRRVYMTPPQP